MVHASIRLANCEIHTNTREHKQKPIHGKLQLVHKFALALKLVNYMQKLDSKSTTNIFVLGPKEYFLGILRLESIWSYRDVCLNTK